MNGAESLVHTALRAGVEVCFANPGTTELPLVHAMDSVSGIRAVLALFEGVCTGAADGYARMSGKPALTLLHLGPGLANGLANLHNARRARSSIINLVGDHASWHAAADAPLSSDIVSLARTVSAFVRTSRASSDVPTDFTDALAAAMHFPGQIATLILPVDFQSAESSGPAAIQPGPSPLPPPEAKVARAAEALRRGHAALMMGGRALLGAGLAEAARIAAATGCTLFSDTFPARIERGAAGPPVEKLPYFPEHVLKRLSEFEVLILAGLPEPVSFFGWPGFPSRLIPSGCTTLDLSSPEEDTVAALASIAEILHAPAKGIRVEALRPEPPMGPLTPQSLGQAIAAVQPEGCIVADESATSGLPHYLISAGLPSFTHLSLTGGAIGYGLPCATGAAIACPERKVLAFQADGSGMYTLQSLWTQAREGLDVTTVLCSNRSYRILRLEMARGGMKQPGPQATALTDLTSPTIDWVDLARGMGVPAVRVETAEAAVDHLRRAFSEPGPHLIEAIL